MLSDEILQSILPNKSLINKVTTLGESSKGFVTKAFVCNKKCVDGGRGYIFVPKMRNGIYGEPLMSLSSSSSTVPPNTHCFRDSY